MPIIGSSHLLHAERLGCVMSGKCITSYTITEMIGFSSVSYFIKTFKNKFGITPKEIIYINGIRDM